jgi:subtilase family serine protease
MAITKKQQELNPGANRRNLRTVRFPLVAVALMASLALPALAATGLTIAHNTPQYTLTAKNLGSEDPAKTIDVSIWLNPHNRAGLDALADQLYDKTSPNYRRFLTPADFAARFAPTAAEAKIVQQFFAGHNLKVVKVGPNNFFVRARGSVGDIETAFHVQLNNYQVRDHVLRANDRDPYIDGAAASLVRSVAGLDTGKFRHPLVLRPTVPPSVGGAAESRSKIGDSIAEAQGSHFYNNDCFPGVETETFSTLGNGSLPIGTYSGNKLGDVSANNPGCGYTPPEIQAAYGLTALYANGYDGSGQTIGIIDWCGSSTILQDANGFSKKFGLPKLYLGSNFQITYIPTPSQCVASGNIEINLDVEWAHAVAPGAYINLIVPPTASFQDIDEAEYMSIVGGLANVLSGSYGAPEVEVAQTELDNGNLLSEMAATLGISTNFSSGDDGDYAGTFGFATVSYPSDLPYATSIGGSSLALNSDNSIEWQDGWGNNEILLAEDGVIADPPYSLGFYGGAGGGPSMCAVQSDGVCVSGFKKPAYQKKLSGKVRQTPDISWLADPFTGAVVYISEPGFVPPQLWTTIGGTSLACPMFSALWAIANQEAGAPLGQAAPYLYSMPASTIFDVVPLTSATNVTASIQEPGYTNKYGAAKVAGITGPFISAIWDYPTIQDTAIALTFGTDSGLKVKKGWDNVTGVGVPNAEAFANYFLAPTP